MFGTKPILLIAAALLLALNPLDCLTTAEAMKCCATKACSPGKGGDDCCKALAPGVAHDYDLSGKCAVPVPVPAAAIAVPVFELPQTSWIVLPNWETRQHAPPESAFRLPLLI